MSTAYLFACGLGAVVWFSFFLLRPDLRRFMAVMSIFGIPLALSDLFYVPQYWRPETIGHIPVGIEGCLFSFEAAGACAVVYMIVSRTAIRDACISDSFPFLPYGRMLTRRLLVPLIPLPVSAFVAIALRTNLEWGLYAGLILAIIVAVILRLDMLLPATVGGFIFLLIYWLALTIWLQAYPSVHGWFTLRGMPHWFIAGVPVEEIVFGGLFAAFWTTVYPLVFAARFERLKSLGEKSHP